MNTKEFCKKHSLSNISIGGDRKEAVTMFEILEDFKSPIVDRMIEMRVEVKQLQKKLETEEMSTLTEFTTKVEIQKKLFFIEEVQKLMA